MLWNQFCLINVCLVWGGRSFTLAQTVLEHGSATVGFDAYYPVLLAAKAILSPECTVTLLADRAFEYGELLRCLTQWQWDWAIRAKTDLPVTLATGHRDCVEAWLPPPQPAHLFHRVTVLDDVHCHLATAHIPLAGEPWAVLTSRPPSLQTFALYGQRFGGMEPHFKDYKSAAFNLLDSGLREASVLTRLLMLLDTAMLIALLVGAMLVQAGQRSRLDWHGQRGLSFLQLGLRDLARRCYERSVLPVLHHLPCKSPPKAYASLRQQGKLECRIKFAKVVVFSG